MSATVTQQPGARLLAIGLFLGVPALLLTMAVLNVLQVAEDRFTLAEKDMQLAALMHRLTSPATDGKPLDLSPIYISGASPALANANLQQHVVTSVAAATGRLIETSVADMATAEGDTTLEGRVGIRANFDIDNGGLLTLLHGLESGVPFVDVETISIRRLPTEDNGADRLRVDMEVSGVWRVRP